MILIPFQYLEVRAGSELRLRQNVFRSFLGGKEWDWDSGPLVWPRELLHLELSEAVQFQARSSSLHIEETCLCRDILRKSAPNLTGPD